MFQDLWPIRSQDLTSRIFFTYNSLFEITSLLLLQPVLTSSDVTDPANITTPYPQLLHSWPKLLRCHFHFLSPLLLFKHVQLSRAKCQKGIKIDFLDTFVASFFLKIDKDHPVIKASFILWSQIWKKVWFFWDKPAHPNIKFHFWSYTLIHL